MAGAAFCLSAISLGTTAFFAWRGSDVLAVPPSYVFLYRDAAADPTAGAVLSAGVDSALVNAASGNHGDAVIKVTMQIGDDADAASFTYQMLVTPVFTERAEIQMNACPVTARCVRNGQFLSIEEARRTLDVPGGASTSEYIGFVLQQAYCAARGACRAYQDFDTAAAALERRPVLTIRFRYQLYSDGEKIATCRVDLRQQGSGGDSKWLSKELARTGWAVLPCLA